MGKLIGIDFGVRRTGLASTDELQIIASGLCGLETQKVIPFLKEFIRKESVDGFIVGDPGGTESPTHSTEAIEKFCIELGKAFPAIPIYRVDESFSSREAMAAMVAAGIPKKKRQDKKLLDQVSATIILQRFLENR